MVIRDQFFYSIATDWMSFSGLYPDTNFTGNLGGWENQGGDRNWIVVNSTIKDIWTLTGQQGGFILV